MSADCVSITATYVLAGDYIKFYVTYVLCGGEFTLDIFDILIVFKNKECVTVSTVRDNEYELVYGEDRISRPFTLKDNVAIDIRSKVMVLLKQDELMSINRK